MDIGKYLHELLLENETVIVPGFGAFVSNYKPAEIKEGNNEMTPPSKEIVFNPKIRNNDGLLVGYVAEKQAISHFDALRIIEKGRENIIYQLDKGERVVLENIGSLSRDEENEIGFEAQIEGNLLLDAFGLETVSLDGKGTGKEVRGEIVAAIPVEGAISGGGAEATCAEEEMPGGEKIEGDQEKGEKPGKGIDGEAGALKGEEPGSEGAQRIEMAEGAAVTENTPGLVFEDQPEAQLEERSGRRGWLWPMLIVIPLIFAGFFLVKDKIFPNQGYEIIFHEDTHVGEPQQSPQAGGTVADPVAMDSVQSLPADNTLRETEAGGMPVETTGSVETKYYLVGGSFKEQENVDKFLEQFDVEGYDPFLLGKRGNYFIVAIGKYSSERDAVRARDTFMKKSPDSGIWVYKDKQ